MKRKSDERSAAATLVPVAVLLTLVLALAATAPADEGNQPNAGLTSVGKGVYKSYCSSCHGVAAKGDSPIAGSLRVAPNDLTTIARDNGGEFPFAEVVKVIDGRQNVRAHGSDMPVWGDVFQQAEGGGGAEKVRRNIDGLAHFLWSIQAEKGS